jgi:hypothetical protein
VSLIDGKGGSASSAAVRSAVTSYHLTRNAGSSRRRERIHEVTSECHLLALHERHAGTTLATV